MEQLYDDNDGILGEPQEDLEDFFAPPELPNQLGTGFVEGEEVEERLEDYDDDEEEPGAAAAAADSDGGGEDDEEEEQQQQQQDLEDQDEGQQQQQQAGRSKLLALAKGGATAGGAEGDEARNKKKKKKHKKDKQQQQQQQDGDAGRPKRKRAAADGSDDGEQQQQQQQRGDWQAELPEAEYAQERADDADFIDDEGVAEEDRYLGDDEDALADAEEAEEAGPGEEEDDGPLPNNIVDEVLARRKRRKKRGGEDGEVHNNVLALVTQMLAVAEADCRVKDEGLRKPAMNKLQALKHVEDTLRQHKYHEPFLNQGGLKAMSQWLAPYKNGELPNIRVRTTLIDLLGLMSLDTANGWVREKLEDSGLGKIVMFYFKNPNEKNIAIRNKCRDLVQAWSAPIFADADEERRKQRLREREHRVRMASDRAGREKKEQREAAEAERRRTAAHGEEGFRARAAVPAPSKLDFVINPGSRLDPLEAAMRGPAAGGAARAAANKSPIGGKLGKLLQKQKRGARDRFGGVSVEGRGMQL